MLATVKHGASLQQHAASVNHRSTPIRAPRAESALARHLPTLQRAESLVNAGDAAQAESLCRAVLGDAPGLPEALALLGMVLLRRDQPDAAAESLNQAIASDATRPQWFHALRDVHRRLYRLDDALAAAEQAVRLDPAAPRYRNALAQIHADRGDDAAAEACLLDALAVAPDDTDLHLSLAHILLARGAYRAGWQEYEWRFRSEAMRRAMPRITRPAWNGMPLLGRRLLLGADQGFGDGFQFARFVAMAAERCAGVVVLCRAPQVAVFRRLPGVVACVTDITQAGEHAAFCWMGSLPCVLGITVETIPPAPYCAPDPARRRVWRAELDRLRPGTGLRVGLCWRGNPANSFDWRRSIPLSLLRPLGALAGVDLVSLQVPPPAEDQVLMAAMGMLDPAARLTDFGETAALTANLDCVVSVDSAILHLAGALGVPGLAMLFTPADWRWMAGRDDSPWYGSLRLLRQPAPGAWAPVAQAVIDAIRDQADIPTGGDTSSGIGHT